MVIAANERLTDNFNLQKSMTTNESIFNTQAKSDEQLLDEQIKNLHVVMEWLTNAPPIDRIVASTLLATVATRGDMGLPDLDEAEVKRLTKWLVGCCADIGAMTGILAGGILVVMPEGADQPSFQLTTRGKEQLGHDNEPKPQETTADG